MLEREGLSSGVLEGSVLDKQIELETKSIQRGIASYWKLAIEATERGEGAGLKPAERMLVWWMPSLRAKIVQEQQEIRAGLPNVGRGVYGPAMLLLDAERIALIAMHEAVGRTMKDSDGVTVAELAYAIGSGVLGEAGLDMLKEEKPDAWRELTRICKTGITPRHGNTWGRKHLADPVWSRRVSMYLGAKLVEMILSLPAKAWKDPKDFEPAFEHKMRREAGKDIGTIKLSRTVFATINDGHDARSRMRPAYLPMLVQPFAWTEKQEGGYVRVRTPLISKATADQKAALRVSDITAAWDGLNTIGSSAWRTNPVIFAVLEMLKTRGGGIAGVPRMNPHPLPAKPIDINHNKVAKTAWKKQAKVVHRANAILATERSVFDPIMAVARDFDQQAFFYPHQFDFRFRAYPMPQHLNHYGSDICRGLLMTADADPLGSMGMFWVKVQAANAAGHDKVPFEAREAWTNKWIADNRAREWIGSVDSICDVAQQTWAAPGIENPVQFLAAIIAAFYPDYAQRLPIQRDGCANGLQHYAAMGRDSDGAAAVSLGGADAMSDIYSTVSDIVRETVAAEVNDPRILAVTVRGKTYTFLTSEIARAVLPHVGRKMAKPIVMRKVYGVTDYGARSSIGEFLREAKVFVTPAERYTATSYLVKKIMAAIGKVCSSAKQIMDWLSACAKLIASTGKPVAWTTPLGLPVVQPYRNWSNVQIKTSLQYLTILLENADAPILKRKHVTAFAPNFVHSVDASHMMIAARECGKAGVWFASVHDSFWTTAGSVAKLDAILRRTFIELHQIPILDNLVAEFRKMHPKIEFPNPPECGDFDLNKVLTSRYAFH